MDREGRVATQAFKEITSNFSQAVEGYEFEPYPAQRA